MTTGTELTIEKSTEIEAFDYWGMPDIAEFAKGLTTTEIRVIDELLKHDPKEKWSFVAERIGIHERRLRQLRRKEIIQQIVMRIKLDEIKSDLAEVYSVLTEKALTGDIAAIKLYLEHIANVDVYYKLLDKKNEDFIKGLMVGIDHLPLELKADILQKLDAAAHAYIEKT